MSTLGNNQNNNMMSKENLFSHEAIEKMKKMAMSIDFTMFTTALNEKPLHIVPMSTRKVDETGAIWFLSNQDSQHNQNIIKDPQMHLIYADPGAMQFLTVYGEAQIITDKTITKELYKSSDDAWFEGENDPKITAIKVIPSSVFYWDPKSNSFISLIKSAVAGMTGKEPDLMDQGELKM
jgi:general stress protein 26